MRGSESVSGRSRTYTRQRIKDGQHSVLCMTQQRRRPIWSACLEAFRHSVLDGLRVELPKALYKWFTAQV
jgi:hypothetical protein